MIKIEYVNWAIMYGVIGTPNGPRPPDKTVRCISRLEVTRILGLGSGFYFLACTIIPRSAVSRYGMLLAPTDEVAE